MFLGGVTGRTWAAPPGAPEPGALHRAAAELAERFVAGAEGRSRVTLLVLASAREELRSAAETALASALTQRGLTVSVLPAREAPQAESVARTEGADWLLRVRPVLGAGGRELTLSGEGLITAANFFLQRAQAPRPRPTHLLTATVPADQEVRQLGRDPRDLDTHGERRIGIRPLWKIEGRVLALAAGDVGDRAVSLVAVTAEAVLLYSAQGELLDRRGTEKLTPGPPVRDPAATVAVGDFGGGRIAYRLAGAAEGEVLAVPFDPGAPRPARLSLAAALPAAPLCAGSAGPLFGAFVPGRSALADRLEPRFDPAGRPRSPREYQVVAAAPRPGRVAYAALGTDDALQLLGPALEPLGPPVQGIGAGFALADLDGSGEPELVASSAEPGVQDRVRVLRLAGSTPETIFESPTVSGSILAGAAADLTGDGLDDAILAALVPGTAPGVSVTQLYLVTGDPRGTP
jgi:hypothetical protein